MGSAWHIKKATPAVPEKLGSRIDKLAASVAPSLDKPWRTIRDALVDVPDPRKRNSRGFLNHNYQAGAKAYPGHTGSPLDLPAKTLKAGDHGVPGGENMMVLENGDVRYFTVRESARLQTFPDGYASMAPGRKPCANLETPCPWPWGGR